jgi:hypothetical protein
MELTMCKSSTLGLVASVLALLVGATLAHAWLLRPEHPVTDVASRSPRLVTIVKGATTGASGTPIEIANRATRQVTIAEPGPTNNGTTRVFGPRGLPARPRSGLWHDVSIDVGPGRMADRFIAEAADTASITCDQVWARPTAGAGTTAAAYFTLTNHGAADELVGASTPVASASVHETINDNGVMKMRPVASIALAPGKTVMFRPGGYHVMLTGLHAPLKAGESFPLTLTFAHAQPITVTVKVQTGGAGMGGGAMPGMR